MVGEKVKGVNLVSSEHTEEGIIYRYTVRVGGLRHEVMEGRAQHKAERDARMRTVSLPRQIERIETKVVSASSTEPGFVTFRVNALVKKAF